MDRSNLLIGAGVLVGLGTLAYWYMNRDGTVRSSDRRFSYAEAAFNVGPFTAPIKPVLPADVDRAIRQRSDAFERNY